MSRLLRRVAIAALLAVVATVPVVTQEQMIPADGEVTGRITSRSRLPDRRGLVYTAPVVAGRNVTIDLTSGSFDTYLIVEAPDGRVYEDDDGGEGLDSRVSLRPSTDGIMTIQVTSYDGNDTGRFRLLLRTEDPSLGGRAPGPTIDQDPRLLLLRNGAAVGYGQIASGEQVFAFDVDDPTNISLTVVVAAERDSPGYSGGDSMLYLFDESWQFVAHDDDGGSGQASRLEDVSLQTPGRYYAVVTTYPNRPDTDGSGRLQDFSHNGESSIDFELHIQTRLGIARPSPTPTPINLDVEHAVRISYGTTLASGSARVRHAAYLLEVISDGALSVEVDVTKVMQGTEYSDDDSMLYLFDHAGRLIAEDDDGGDGYQSLIDSVSVSPGIYYAVVTTYPNGPVFDDDDVLRRFSNDGESSIEFDLHILLE